jgi:hypothetical protein
MATGFQVTDVQVRKLVWEDLPNIPLVNRLYRYLPQPLLDRIGKWFGWYVIARARKETVR